MKRTRLAFFLLNAIVLALILLAMGLNSGTTVVAATTPLYGLEWPGDGAIRRMLYWHNPFPIYDATYVFKVFPRTRTTGPTGYYTTFFWGNDCRFDWQSGGANTYYGAHPYPIPAPNGPGQWEISVNSNDYVTGSEVQWGRWYTQAFRAWRESPSITHHEFYWDWPDTSKVISRTVVDSNWAKQNPPIPAIVIGQAPDFNGASWGGYPGWEEFNGIIRGIQIYSGLLSIADLQAEINAPKSTSAGQNFIWYLNTDPRPGDVADKKGTGTSHNPLWSGTTALEWTDQPSSDTTPPSTPTNVTAAVVSASEIDVSWTASTDNVGVTGYSVERCPGSACTNFTQISTPGGTSYSDPGLAANTSYRYRVRATDAAGNLSSYSSIASATTPTPPDTTPPTVSINSPSNSSSVSATIMVSATASDNVGVVGVQFILDGTNLGAEVMTAPYAVTWNTTTALNGSHSLTAVARDAAGNQTISSTVAVTAANAVSPPPPPPTPGPVPAPTPTAGQTISYVTPPMGGQSWITNAVSGSLQTGYARIQPTSGPTPSGTAIFGFRSGGVLVSEAGVPASSLIPSGRIFVDVGGPVNTGIAIANPNDVSATIDFYFTNIDGADFGQGSLSLPANHQMSAFLNESPFNGGSSVQGTFTFSSSVPISVIALRGLTNERGEFLMTTLPVSLLNVIDAGSSRVLPHFANGGGWTTQVILVNPTEIPQSGMVQFVGQGSASGTAPVLNIEVNGANSSAFYYTIPARASLRMRTGNGGNSIQVGSVRVAARSTSAVPSATSIFSFKSGGINVNEDGGASAPAGGGLLTYVETSAKQGELKSTGLAIANPSQAPVNVNFELRRLDGSSTGLSASVTIPSGGQIARFANELLSGFPPAFQGILRLTATSPVTVTSLRGRYNERGDFLITTSPPWNEASNSTTQMLFPHIASGAGYATQFILFAGGQSATGSLNFFTRDGAPMSDVNLAPIP